MGKTSAEYENGTGPMPGEYSAQKRYMRLARSIKCALLSEGMLKLSPAANMVTAINGRVKSNKDRRPRVSIVQMAGNAPRKFTKPNTQEATSAPKVLKPASEKMLDE